MDENILEYKIALNLQDKLVRLYKPGMDIQKLERKVKSLVKKMRDV